MLHLLFVLLIPSWELLAAADSAPLAPEPHLLPPGALGALLAEQAGLPRGDVSGILAPAWSAQFSGGMFPTAGGHYYYDAANRRNRQTFAGSSPIFGPSKRAYFDSLNAETGGKYNKNMTVGKGKDSVCKPLPGNFMDPFAWLKVAKPMGTKVLDGVSCRVYLLELSFRGATATFSTCVAADGSPRELNESLPMKGFGGPSYFRFQNITVGPQDPHVFQASDACASRYPTASCPRGRVRELDLYRVHGASEPATLANRDLGDASGDMAFFCAFNAFKSLGGSLVTRWRVRVNSSYGQYSYCLYHGGSNSCMGGGPGKEVGRESALGSGSGRLQGQCSPNWDVGSWFSFPADGQCAPGQPVGSGGCTWAAAAPVRTVTAACILQDRGLLKSCAREFGHPPFRRSIAIFKAALASSDPARGGCPDAAATGDVVLV